jgi:hypothetical protein
VSGIWSRKFYDPKIWNGPKIGRFPKPERNESEEVLLDWFKQQKSEEITEQYSLHVNFCYF